MAEIRANWAIGLIALVVGILTFFLAGYPVLDIVEHLEPGDPLPWLWWVSVAGAVIGILGFLWLLYALSERIIHGKSNHH